MDIVNLREPLGADWRNVSWPELTRAVTLEDGEQVSYVDLGAGTGPVLLLVHGLGGSWRVWLENLLPLGESRRVIAVDLPGFGDSPADLDVIRFDEYAKVLEKLCRHLGLTEVVAVGNSFGGWVCAELARRAPDLVKGLVLVDAAGIPATRREAVKVVGMLRMADVMAPVGCRQRERLAASPKLRRRAFGFIVSRADLMPGDLAIHLMPEVPSPVFRPVLQAAVSCWSHHWTSQIATLDVPALVVWGSLDKQLPLRHAHEWVRLLRHSTLVLVDGAGHMPMLEVPKAFNAQVLDFLRAVSLHGDVIPAVR